VTDLFRAEVRDWLDAHVPAPPLPSLDTAEGFEAHRAWERSLAAARLAVVTWPAAYGGRDATVRPIRQLGGRTGFAEIFLDEVFVPDCDVVGEPGDGWRIAMSTASHERGLSLRSPGRFLAAAGRLVSLWRRCGGDPALGDRVADAWIGARAYQLHTQATVARLAAGGTLGPDLGPGLGLWRRLADLGVTALAVPEKQGGLGASPLDLVVACEELGHHAVPGPVAESLAAVPVLLGEAGSYGERLASCGEWLAGLAAGDLIATLAAPPCVPLAADGEAAGLVLSAGRDVSVAKVACAEAAYRAARAALQVHGAIGYTAEHELSRFLLQVRALVPAWGTSAEHRARVLREV
jgi:alkylation response protein AidB-like acyl-CoA dehydrogenase